MVDLVKIRRKAKERKERAEAALPGLSPGEAESSFSSEPVTPAAAGEGQASHGAAQVSAPPQQFGVSVMTSETPSQRLDAFRKKLGQRRPGMNKTAADPLDRSVSAMELLVFELAGEMYALPIEEIVEIVDPKEETRVPNAGREVVGIISLRGTIVTVLDVRGNLGHPPGLRPAAARIIVVRHGEETAGFLVDRVSRVVTVDAREVENHPVISPSEQHRAIRGVFLMGSSLTILLDLDKLLSTSAAP